MERGTRDVLGATAGTPLGSDAFGKDEEVHEVDALDAVAAGTESAPRPPARRARNGGDLVADIGDTGAGLNVIAFLEKPCRVVQG